MKIVIPTGDVLLDTFPDDDGVKAVDHLSPGVLARLAEISSVLPDHAQITLARDWEGCLFGLVDANGDQPPPFDVVAFTTDGRVGHGGVNLPNYYDTVAQLLAADLERRERR